MSGFAGGGSCWPAIADAAAAACGAVSGTTSEGVASCDGVVLVSDTGAVLALRWTSSSGAVTMESPITLPACEAYDFETFWSPIIGAAFVAIAAVVCFKTLWRPFKTEG